MSVGRKTGSKPLAFITSLMVLFALVVPFAGAALANHDTDADPTQVTLTPETDSAPTGTCNPFTATVNQGGAGETVDVYASQSDSDTNADITIAFCDPDGAGAGTDAGGDTDTDEALFGEAPAEIFGQCFTDAAGNCTFGVTSNEAGTMSVRAFYDANDNNTEDAGEPFDVSTKTWTGGGQAAAENITCTPATDTNPEGSRHEFQCTVTDSAGTVLPGVTVSFDVTAGPNAEEVAPTNCGGGAAGTGTTSPGGSTTNAQGQTPAANTDPDANNTDECGYSDAGPDVTTSPPGTDTIVAYVNQTQQAGQPAPTAGPDAGEPQVTIQKTWVGLSRTIDCEPETASNPVGTSHNITCTVKDNAGNPVPNANVDFTHPSGPGFLNSDTTDVATDANGQATVTISTQTDDATGTSTVRGTLDQADPQTGANCTQAAGTPTGAPAGVCFDDVQKTWTRTGPTQAECNDGVDNDGDGRIDHPNDPDCSDINDTTEAHFPGTFRVATNLTIRYDPPNFKGSVGSPRKRCQQGRAVTLKKVTPGPNRTVGKDTSNREGSWSIRKRRARGRYYAVVARKQFTNGQGDTIICLRDKSVTINTNN